MEYKKNTRKKFHSKEEKNTNDKKNLKVILTWSLFFSPNDIEKAKEDKARTLDDVLAESVGKWGWFQVRIMIN